MHSWLDFVCFIDAPLQSNSLNLKFGAHTCCKHVRKRPQHHLDTMTDYITWTLRFICVDLKKMNILCLYFTFSPLRMYSYEDKLERGGLRVGEWRKTGEREESGGKWGNWESYGHVKQRAQWFLTAQRCVLVPPAQGPRSEVRRNRGTKVWESVRKRPEVGKFSKLNKKLLTSRLADWTECLEGRERGRLTKRDKNRDKKNGTKQSTYGWND